jgi:hypothetical protein
VPASTVFCRGKGPVLLFEKREHLSAPPFSKISRMALRQASRSLLYYFRASAFGGEPTPPTMFSGFATTMHS